MYSANLKVDLGNLESRLHGWFGRAKSALDAVETKFGAQRHAAVLAAITKAHDQAAQVLAQGGSTAPGDVNWELAHGLSILGRLSGAKPLPRTPDELKTVVMKDGTLLGCRQWELLDPRWGEALVQWLEHLDRRATFATSPAMITIPNRVMLAIAGDWGTGAFDDAAPAVKVGRAISALKPDYTIHLGDVYYAGIGTEENNDLSNWPKGQQGSFTLNSNHEMYNGSMGYFAELAANFPLQKNTSYFCLQNDQWLLIAVDSAYYSDAFDLYMKGTLDAGQLRWLASLPKGKKVIVLSHHEGYDALGNKKTALYDQVAGALGRDPDYWYWGHLHNAICYAPRAGFHGRCVGHGAIPYGNASMLAGDAAISWYETKLAGDPNYPERVLNGFAKITLTGPNITEELIAEDGSLRWSSVIPAPAAVPRP